MRHSSYIPEPHDADIPEDTIPECGACGAIDEDGEERVVIAEELALLGMKRPGKIWLCSHCQDKRYTAWTSDPSRLLDILQALAEIAGEESADHPELLSVRIAAHLPYRETTNPGGVR